MLHGVQPTTPCTQCGVVPEFSDPVMSLAWRAGDPVKGVDGREYATCPKCGEGDIELHGANPVGWGWQLVCPGCGWKQKQAEGLDIKQYCDLMDEAASRLESANHLLAAPSIPIRARVESICLQARMLLEIVVFSSLVSNKDVWQNSQKDLQSSRDISRKVKELQRLHPNFYPQPLDPQERTAEGEPRTRRAGFLSEGKLIEVYGRLGNVLHAANPMGRSTDYSSFAQAVPRWLAAVARLLEFHKVSLYHHPREFYVIRMLGAANGEVLCIPFTTTPEGRARCAWPDCVSPSAPVHCEYLARPWEECVLPAVEPAQMQAKADAAAFDRLL